MQEHGVHIRHRPQHTTTTSATSTLFSLLHTPHRNRRCVTTLPRIISPPWLSQSESPDG